MHNNIQNCDRHLVEKIKSQPRNFLKQFKTKAGHFKAMPNK